MALGGGEVKEATAGAAPNISAASLAPYKVELGVALGFGLLRAECLSSTHVPAYSQEPQCPTTLPTLPAD